MSRSLSIDRHARLRSEIAHAERKAAYELAAVRAQSAEELAEAVARRAIAALHAKTEAAPREIEP